MGAAAGTAGTALSSESFTMKMKNAIKRATKFLAEVPSPTTQTYIDITCTAWDCALPHFSIANVSLEPPPRDTGRNSKLNRVAPSTFIMT